MAAAMDPTATFRQEAADLLEQLEETLLDLESDPTEGALIDKAFRALHTIKGSGSMFGFDAVAAFTHHLETAFEAVRSHLRPATPPLISLTLSSLDHIRSLIDAPESADPARGETILLALREELGEVQDALPAPAPEAGGGTDTAQTEAGQATWRIRFRLDEDVLSFGTNPLLLLNELRDLGPCEVAADASAVPGLRDMNPVGCYLSWDVRLTTDQPQAAIEDVFIFVSDAAKLSIEPEMAPEAAIPATERREAVDTAATADAPSTRSSVPASQATSSSPAGATRAPEHQNSIRVQADRLDRLMDQVGELVIAQARLNQLCAGGDQALQAVAEEIERLSADLRDTTMGIRMLPIGTLFGRFRRVVRDLSQSLGKDVALTTEGEDTELDKTVIDSLADPLVHLIRNSMDHGIEDAAAREAAGKAAAGDIHLSAVHSGAQVLITVRDDGRGLNRTAIRAKAEDKGLIAPGTELPDADLLALIFEPGFSTAEQVSSVSGRGVGMDVVRQAVNGLRGTINVESTPGRGTAVTLKLPLTLAIIDGLLVQIGGGRYVIPLSVVDECVDLTPEEAARSIGRNFFTLRGDIVPFLRMRDLFAVPGQAEGYQKVVVVTSGGNRVGLVVDHVIGQYQTVIKSLSRLLDDVEQFSGATILGDGTVALILDVPHLIDFAQAREAERKAS